MDWQSRIGGIVGRTPARECGYIRSKTVCLVKCFSRICPPDPGSEISSQEGITASDGVLDFCRVSRVRPIPVIDPRRRTIRSLGDKDLFEIELRGQFLQPASLRFVFQEPFSK